MTAREIAELVFAFHANRLERALGRGGAAVDLATARAEVAAVQSALDELRLELEAEAVQ